MKLVHWLVLVVAIILLAGMIWYQAQDVRLSTAPPRAAANADLPERTSVLQLHLSVPHDALEQAANRVLPGKMSISGHGKNVCVDASPLGKHCAGTKYSATIRSEGEFDVHRQGEDLAASLVISVKGHGGLRGDGARFVKVDKKNFRAKARIDAILRIGLTEDWCPDVRAQLKYDWLEPPKVEIVHKVWVNVENQVGEHIDRALKDLAAQVESAIPCEPIQQAVAEVWTPRAVHLTLDGSQLFANVAPKSLGLSDVQVSEDSVRLILAAEAVTEIATTAMDTRTSPGLPLKAQVDEQAPSRLDFALALRAGYPVLQEQLQKKLGGQSFEMKTAQGDVRLTPRSFQVYPSGDQVAVGLEFEADVPGQFFDVQGEVFVTATPRSTPDGLGLTLENVSISRRLDHELWEVLTAVFEQKLIGAIETAGRVDLGPAWRQAEATLQEQLAANTAGTGLKLRTGKGTARIAEIVPEEEELAAIVEISLPVSATLREIPLG